MTPPFTVGLVGMGRIACGFDEPGGLAITTHLKAVLAEYRLKLSAVADRDRTRAENETRRFGVDARVLSPEELVRADLDVLCIASPDGTHVDYLDKTAGGACRVIVVEKPLDAGAERRKAALDALAARGAKIAVNHLRRWIPDLASWMDAARTGTYGRPLSISVTYGRGFRHNAIHALDLVAGFLAPQLIDAKEIAPPIPDYSLEDETRSILATIQAASGHRLPLTLYGVDGRVQTAFSFDIRFERARVLIHDEGGVRAELQLSADCGVRGFAPELRTVVRFRDDPPRLMARLWSNIADNLETSAPFACAAGQALEAYELADEMLARIA